MILGKARVHSRQVGATGRSPLRGRSCSATSLRWRSPVRSVALSARARMSANRSLADTRRYRATSGITSCTWAPESSWISKPYSTRLLPSGSRNSATITSGATILNGSRQLCRSRPPTGKSLTTFQQNVVQAMGQSWWPRLPGYSWPTLPERQVVLHPRWEKIAIPLLS